MTDWLKPAVGEAERLRLFRADRDPIPLMRASAGIDADRAVVVRLADLGGMSVSGYLSEGFDLPDGALMEAGETLRGLKGWLACVPPSAVRGPIAPAHGLEPLAALRMSEAPALAPDLATPDAQGEASPAAPPPEGGAAPRKGGGLPWVIAILVAGIALLVALVLAG